MADGLLDLYEATGKGEYLDEAKGLAAVLLERYADEAGGGFYFTSDDHEELLLRSKDTFDSALPSGNGVAARVLVRLGASTGEERYVESARGTVEAFRGVMERAPTGTQTLILAAAMYEDAATTASGNGGEGLLARARRQPVTVEAWLTSGAVARGETAAIEVRLIIDEGWHVNAHDASRAAACDGAQDGLVAATVSVDGQSATLGEVVYAPGKEVALGFSDEAVSVYEGEVRIAATVALSADAGGSEVVLQVDFQACSEVGCLRPEQVLLSIPIPSSE